MDEGPAEKDPLSQSRGRLGVTKVEELDTHQDQQLRATRQGTHEVTTGLRSLYLVVLTSRHADCHTGNPHLYFDPAIV